MSIITPRSSAQCAASGVKWTRQCWTTSFHSIEMYGSICQRKLFDHLSGKVTDRPHLDTFAHTEMYWAAPQLRESPGLRPKVLACASTSSVGHLRSTGAILTDIFRAIISGLELGCQWVRQPRQSFWSTSRGLYRTLRTASLDVPHVVGVG